MSEDGIKSIAKSDYSSKFKEVNWTNDINKEMPIKMTREGLGSEVPITISQAFIDKAQRFKKEICMIMKRKNQKQSNSLAIYTWQLFYDKALLFAKALHKLGIKERMCICIMGYNSPEHFVCMIGTLLSNCILTEVYLTNGADTCLYQVKHSESRIIICDTFKRYQEKFLPHKNELEQLGVKAVILFGEFNEHRSSGKSKNNHIKIYTWP